MPLFARVAVRLLAALALASCADVDAPDRERGEGASLAGEPVSPPFAVREGAPDLVLTYVDAEGPHTVTSVAEVPADARDKVRVDSLSVAPERRLDPERVYLADLRRAGPDGVFPVRVVPRAAFEAYVEGHDEVEGATAAAGGEVVLYGASWCGACREARAYLRRRGIAFVEHDIEREPSARAEMLEKARAAGVPSSGIPVIDFRGTILAGFSREAIDRLIARGGG